MSKVYIGVGHGGSDSGAAGYLIEKTVNLKMAQACRDYLAARGVEVLMSRTTDKDQVLTTRIRECNQFDADLALDVHNNAGNGDGFEIFHSIVGGKGQILAKNIEAEVVKLGQNSRGLKTRTNSSGSDYFGFIRQTLCPAVICEGVFVDNKQDSAQADTDAECRAFGEAYAKGVLKTLGIEDTTGGAPAAKPTEPAASAPSKTGSLVQVTTDALNIRSGAGTSFQITGVIRDRGTYTIVDTKKAGEYTWGKLKSGAGWIALEYTKQA